MTTNQRQQISDWVHENMSIFDELNFAVTSVARAAGHAGRVVDGSVEGDPEAAMRDLERPATILLGIVGRARALDPVPDVETAGFFDAALARWQEGSAAIARGATERDGPMIVSGARNLDAGSDEFVKCAAVLRRASGQPPDPANPHN